MSESSSEGQSHEKLTELKSRQRRVLGVLVEKALTTPDYYPMTLKAVLAGCNQKSNRDPVVEYHEVDVEETIEQLREMGLVAVVHTESGRTERYRHYMRHRVSLSEPQLAILTELLLRGRQQLGELRSRASRMVPIESLDVLRDELSGLIEQGYAQSSGLLERRGVEVDHNLYTEREREKHTLTGGRPAESDEREMSPPSVSARESVAAPAPPDAHLQNHVEEMRTEQRELRDLVLQLQSTVEELQRQLDELRRDLGA